MEEFEEGRRRRSDIDTLLMYEDLNFFLRREHLLWKPDAWLSQ